MPLDEAEELLAFLDSIEGAGYGGMMMFECARQSVRRHIEKLKR